VFHPLSFSANLLDGKKALKICKTVSSKAYFEVNVLFLQFIEFLVSIEVKSNAAKQQTN
jgi:hypothetical protein